MSITDELREWTRTHTVNCSDNRIALVAIADRIDAEHQKALDEWKAEHGQMWLKGYSECHAELLEGNETLASDLERCGWVRLPVDADGEPIHVGDRVQLLGNDPSTVSHMSLASDGWRVHVKYDGDLGTGSGEPNRMRHYTPPTVEGVLREFADRVCNSGHQWGLEAADTIAEYAAKLRLAGDGE